MINVIRVFRALLPLKISNVQLYDQLNEKFNQLEHNISQVVKDEITTLLKSLTPKYSKGDQMLPIMGFEKIIFADDDTTTQLETEFEVKNGIVYLLEFWKSMEPSCDELLEQSQQLLQKYKNWEGKVKVVGMAIDNWEVQLIEKVKQKQWKSLEHYRFLRYWMTENGPILYLQDLNLNDLPLIIIINKQGKIVFLGKPQEVNLEAKINELINENDELFQQQEEKLEIEQKEFNAITNTEYKELKQSLKNLQKAFKEEQLVGEVDVCLELISYRKSNGSKVVRETSKLALSYILDVQEEKKIKSILEKHWDKIPDNLKVVQKQKIRDPVRQIKELQKKLYEVYTNLGVQIKQFEIGKTQVKYINKSNSLNVTKNLEYSLSINNFNIDIYEKGKKNMQDYFNQYDRDESEEIYKALEQIKQSTKDSLVGIGKKFFQIKGYKKWKEEGCSTIEHIPGQVLIIVYWLGTNSNRCHIITNTELLSKNQKKWGQQVKFVYLNISAEIHEVSKQDMQKNHETLKYIDFYFPTTENLVDREVIDIGFPPYYIVVDKFGIIRKLKKVKIDESIIEDLINEQVPFEFKEEPKADFSKKEIEQVLDIIQNPQTIEKLKEVDKVKIIEFDMYFESIKDFEVQDQFEVAEKIKYKKPKLNLFCQDFQLKVVNQILNQIFKVIPEEYWQINKEIQKTYSIQYPGSVCAVCSKDIINEAQQYYSPFKQEHVCVECAEFDDKMKKGYERFKYFDTLIFINGPLSDKSVLDNIEDYKVGKNLKLPGDEEGSQCHQIRCNGCRCQPEDGPRFIAANATHGKYTKKGFFDYCQGCFLILKHKKSEQAQEIFENDEISEDNLLVRILFNYGNYTEF